jgi:hypothetical protein
LCTLRETLVNRVGWLVSRVGRLVNLDEPFVNLDVRQVNQVRVLPPVREGPASLLESHFGTDEPLRKAAKRLPRAGRTLLKRVSSQLNVDMPLMKRVESRLNRVGGVPDR